MEEVVDKIKSTNENDEEEEDDDEDDDEDEDERVTIEGCYNPADYENLNVSPSIKDLFNYINYYSPQTVDIDVKLKPFIPDYIPAVGDVDAFIKIPRPDNVDDGLGLTVLDEPSTKTQSDSTLLNLHLRAVSKDVKMTREIASATKIAASQKDIDSWIENLRHLHEVTSASSTPLTLTLHSQKLPDIEQLMQEWPEDFERALNQYSLPTSDLDCSLDEYVNIICCLLDIPIHSSKIAALHLLFNLYNEFQSSQHFKHLS